MTASLQDLLNKVAPHMVVEVPLQIDTDYAAVIVDTGLGDSKAGNAMATLEFKLTIGRKVRGYYVLSNEYGLKKFTGVVSALLGDEWLNADISKTVDALIGKRVTVRLDTYVSAKGGESFNVKSVKA
ncbi:MAG TPA: hypothetical protein DEG43_03655 [Acidimicrobiaceae bacterium]|nr:hypothetical protein [Acidimicrobiaceae bacterium]